MLQNSTGHLITTINNDNSTEEEVNNAAKEFLDSFQNSTQAEQTFALQKLCASLASNYGKLTYILADLIGYLLTLGSTPQPVITQLIKYFEKLLISAVKVTESFEVKMKNSPAVEDEEEPDVYELFGEYYREFAPRNRELAADWEKFEDTWCCGISLFSVSKDARDQARYLRESTRRANEFSQGAHWFNTVLPVFDEEPFIAIELEKQIGVRGKMSGVVENFQLHVLLMDIFPNGGLASGKPSPEIIENAKGMGKQCLESVVTGRWNMYGWTIVKPELKTLDYSSTDKAEHWIWGEGKPEDIPVFEGHRVVLLGEPLYQRSWRAQRMFDQLKAELKVERKLSQSEVKELLQRMAVTPKPASSIE